jgi:NCAIR mutase (PurE)-related protein
MNQNELKEILVQVNGGEMDVEQAMEQILELPYQDMGFAKIDTQRELRVGYPEVIYCQGKTVDQVKQIVQFMLTKGKNILATRASEDQFSEVQKICPEASYNSLGKVITIRKKDVTLTEGYIAIVCAGTSDLPVVEEAAETAALLGNRVVKVTDVGVAGIHRLFGTLPEIRKAKVVIVVAGMEGALASVVAGLVDKPVIAVPTSVGYGASFGGIAALLAMLNSCASGVTVVNIDNGFGAAYSASMMNHL